MRREIENILRSHAVDGTFHTHVSMLQPKGRFQFNRQTLEKFWEEYTQALEEGGDEELYGIAEKPHHNYIPVLVDVDIKIKEVDGIEIGEEHLYSEEQVQNTIKIYQSVLRNIVEDCQDEDLTCVLLEKPVYRLHKDEVTYAKNGFHLHFPYLFLNKVDQQVQLIPRVQEKMNELRVFEDLGFEDSGSLIDKASCTVPWLLYGSRKSENMDPYTVTKVFDCECNEIDLEEAFKYYRLFDMREELIPIKGKVKQYLPRILSIIPYGRETKELKHGLISPLKEKIKEKKQNSQKMKVSVAEALKISEKLLPMLADWRAEDRNEWMTIGWILFNIGEGCPEALDQWMDFSSRCGEKFDESNCIYEWERMVTKDLTLGTLRYYASVDNPEAYKEFKKEQAEHYVKEALNGSHNDIAKILYAEYGNEFVCASILTKTWYQFTNHKWEPIEEGVFLREKISGEIVDRFVKMGQEIIAALGAADDMGDKAAHNARMKQIQKIINNLKSAPFKSNIMKESMEVFYDRRFREKLDTNPYIIAFKNGVYDLKLNVFRPGRPEDFVSKSMPIDYIEYDHNDEMVQEVYNYLEKVFPDKSVRTYFMDQSSDVFVGGNSQKVVIFWTGEGDNAKSVTQGLFEKMLGPLAIKFNTTVVTGKKPASGSAYADLARAGGGVRWAVLEEPDGDEMVNVGVLKHLSGNDSFYARDLFERGKDGREIVPLFKLIFICNKLPKMKYADKATWNRIRVIPFEATFVRAGEPCPDSYEEQMRQKRFPMDPNFAAKIPKMVQAFAWVLLEHRKRITVRIEPEKVKAATAMYRKQNDIYRQFVEENIIEEASKSITLTELYAHFKEWFKEGFPHHTIPVKNEIKEYFSRVWDEPQKGMKWQGYRVRTLKDDLDTGEAIEMNEKDLVNYGDDGNALPPV